VQSEVLPPGRPQAPPPGRPEALRQIIHLLMLSFALLLRPGFLAWWQAALLALAALVPAVLLSRSVRRVDEPRISGVVLYPASVLLVILLFRRHLHIAAAAWAVLAVGDAASNLFGRRFGRTTLPWNTRKSVAGSAAMLLFSFPAALFLLWWTAHPDFPVTYYLALAAAGAFFGTLFESLRIPLNDNPAIILASSLTMYVVHLAVAR